MHTHTYVFGILGEKNKMRRGNIGEEYSWYISGTAHHSDTKVKQDLKSSLWCMCVAGGGKVREIDDHLHEIK